MMESPARVSRDRREMLGFDLGTLQQLEDGGASFSDGGQALPVERILADHGATHIRQRLWVDPPIPYNDLPHALVMARRAQAAGLDILLDLHYADFWADPSKQATPARWASQDLDTLGRTIREYSRTVLHAFAEQRTPVAVVQIGNEVTNGMLWPQGQLYAHDPERWEAFALLLQAGIGGVRDASVGIAEPEIMIHIDRGADNEGSRNFFDHILAFGLEFDVIGLSYYPWWHGTLVALKNNLHDLANRYRKDIVVVETAYPWTLTNGDGSPNQVGPTTELPTEFPPTTAGQLAFLRYLRVLVAETPHHHGRGMVYWEPAWVPGAGWEPGAGNPWDNLTLFDRRGRALASIRWSE